MARASPGDGWGLEVCVRPVVFGLLLPLAACIPSAQSYLDDVQSTYCLRLSQCEPESFDARYDGLASCVSDGDSQIAKATDCIVEACSTFDAGQGAAALASIRQADCSTLGATTLGAIDDPYSDCDGVKLALCLAGF